MKVVFVPISIVGCGKSTIFRALCSVFPNFRCIENDSCSSKGAFYRQAKDALADPSVTGVLLDRNNHLLNHRKEIMQNFRQNEVFLVALLFMPLAGKASEVYDTSWDRITRRGDNHPLVKAESEVAKSRMIINSMCKHFVNYNRTGPYDSQFDYVVQLSLGKESSRRNIQTIVGCYERICKEKGMDEKMPSPDMLDEAINESLVFQIPQDK